MLTAYYCNPSTNTTLYCVTYAPFNVSFLGTGLIGNPLVSNTPGSVAYSQSLQYLLVNASTAPPNSTIYAGFVPP
jgi:hypothetical protein